MKKLHQELVTKLHQELVKLRNLYNEYLAIATNPKATASQRGASLVGMSIVIALIGAIITIILIADVVPILWPMAETASANITNMSTSTQGGQLIVSFWPIVLLVVGIGLAVGAIVWALGKFGIIGR